jgi:hypothetical protein
MVAGGDDLMNNGFLSLENDGVELNVLNSIISSNPVFCDIESEYNVASAEGNILYTAIVLL